MVLSTDDVLEACRIIAREDDLKLCMYESTKGAGITGASAFVGGVVLGPIGLALGGAIGGLLAYSSSNSYTPLIEQLSSMTNEEKLRLKQHLMDVITRFEITDAVMLMALISSPDGLARQAIVKGLGSFFGQKW